MLQDDHCALACVVKRSIKNYEDLLAHLSNPVIFFMEKIKRKCRKATKWKGQRTSLCLLAGPWPQGNLFFLSPVHFL